MKRVVKSAQNAKTCTRLAAPTMKSPPGRHDDWKDQFARVKRWHAKTITIDKDRTDVSQEEYDVLLAFFLNCWHLYDWLKQSQVLQESVLEAFFREDGCMKKCYDICIGAKHLHIDYPKEGFSRVMNPRQYRPDDLASGRSQIIFFETGWDDMSRLANRCMEAVESFLRKTKLL